MSHKGKPPKTGLFLKLENILGANIGVFIANHIHIALEWGSWGITLDNYCRRSLCNVNGYKSDDSAFKAFMSGQNRGVLVSA